MIISRTPLRISFVGGGSDLPAFYEKSPGAVISVTINKYIYLTVNEMFNEGIRLSYSETEIVDQVDKIRHKYVREILKYLDMTNKLEITTMADVPSRGTGLGSSSAFTVGLLNALRAYRHEFSTAERLATEACHIEIERCQEPIGKQDQHAVAFGGLNYIQFNPDHSVYVNPIICKPEIKEQLDKNLLMFYTGVSRSASEILSQQKHNYETQVDKIEIMKKMVELAKILKVELEKNNLDAFGEILHENWELKKQMANGISNPQINEWYEKARRVGASGGKILGAGGGGFLLIYAPQGRHEAIKKALAHLRHVDFKFENQGSKIIFIH